MAHIFLNPAPYDAPNTPHIAFCRFLSLLAANDWSKPLVVDFDGEMTREDRHAVQLSYERQGKSAPLMYVASRFDPHALFLDLPDDNTRAQLVRLSKHALAIVRERFGDLVENPGPSSAWKAMFVPDF